MDFEKILKISQSYFVKLKKSITYSSRLTLASQCYALWRETSQFALRGVILDLLCLPASCFTLPALVGHCSRMKKGYLLLQRILGLRLPLLHVKFIKFVSFFLLLLIRIHGWWTFDKMNLKSSTKRKDEQKMWGIVPTDKGKHSIHSSCLGIDTDRQFT